MPAADGTGVIAGGGMRPVLEMAGVRNVIGKSQGSKNRLNVVKATFDALSQLRTAEAIQLERHGAPVAAEAPAAEAPAAEAPVEETPAVAAE